MIAPEADPSRVRLADLQDEEELMTVAAQLHAENGIYNLCRNKVREELRASLEQKSGIIGVIGERNFIQGAAWLLFVQEWYTDDWCIMERFNYVLPQWRASTNAKDLIAWTKVVRARCGVPLHIGVFSNERTEAKVRLYRKQLGEPAGAFFLVGAQTGHGAH